MIFSVPELSMTVAGSDEADILRVLEEYESGEPAYGLEEVASLFPGVGAGQLSGATVRRLATVGVKLSTGATIRLATFRCGRLWVTTKPAIRRFILAQTRDRIAAGSADIAE
ncbi:MAG: hypothetical protein LC104_06635 [Bacteroidales bacterium]|nr:hypothetical protein [Bacteroidales bacterium]